MANFSKRTFKSNLITKKWANFNGIPEMMKNLEKVSERVEGEEVIRILEGAAEIQRTNALAQFDANGPYPYGVGLTRSAIFVSRGKDPFANRLGPSVVAGVSHRRAPHSHWLELGIPARGIAARPFWRPALNQSRPAISAFIANGVSELLFAHL